MLHNAWNGLRTVFAPTRGSAQTYVEKNLLGIFGLVLLVGAVPEILLHHVLVPRGHWWIAFLLDVLVLYTAAWVLALYASMAQRPHVLDEEHIVFHRGALGYAEVERAAIVHVVPLTNPDARAIRRENRQAYFGVPGCDLVQLLLSAPARIKRTFPSANESTSCELFVATDRPHELCALLRSGELKQER